MLIPLLASSLFLIFFILMAMGLLDRRFAMLAGAGAMVVLGGVMGFYPLVKVVESIYFETLALIFGMSMISATLSKAGFFADWARRAAIYTHGNGWVALVVLTLITYFFSLFVNNLATMVVMLPITLALCRAALMNTVPVLIALIIASNLGGASTIMGDFPNMIISSAGQLHFLDFIGGMMPPCLVMLAAMLLFFQWRKELFFSSSSQVHSLANQDLERFLGEVDGGSKGADPRLTAIGITVLMLVLVGFLLAEWLGVRPGVIALAAGVLLLFLVPFPGKTVLEAASLGDILFFFGLFVLVGGVQAAGVLKGVTGLIVTLGAGNPTLELLAFMWLAALVTPFLNAGPATAFFIPVAVQMHSLIPGDGVWWALSLGVLAGSSMALTGATAGSVAASHLERDWASHPGEVVRLGEANGLNFRNYLIYGLPISLLFLSLSSVYLIGAG